MKAWGEEGVMAPVVWERMKSPGLWSGLESLTMPGTMGSTKKSQGCHTVQPLASTLTSLLESSVSIWSKAGKRGKTIKR